jgi:hypothetical protein
LPPQLFGFVDFPDQKQMSDELADAAAVLTAENNAWMLYAPSV